jgi:NAD(P)-dependent dehydrogenase (short-subunit alcohol dehydrogenase family)
MSKVILITGSTDGIGLETAKLLTSMEHHVLLHGRNPAKLEQAEKTLAGLSNGRPIASYLADLSKVEDVEKLANAVMGKHDKLDVLINNAGVFKTPHVTTAAGLDVRFVVNTLAPYLLSRRLLPLLGPAGRVINLSSAAQSPVDPDALAGRTRLSDDFNAYAQSKLAITMWTNHMARSLRDNGPVIIAVNPGSLLGTKMVKEGFGMAGHDVRIGADILVRAALSDEFAAASGKYFDNDAGSFSSPHPDVLDSQKCSEIVNTMDTMLNEIN